MTANLDDQMFSDLVRTALLSIGRARHQAVTQREVAEEIGISYRTLQEWLGGRTTPAAAVALLRLICLLPDPNERLELINLWAQRSAEAQPH